jgi:shikimate dehydrogenase
MSAPKAFVAGWPVAHSRSPAIHRSWLDRYGLQGDYVAEAVTSENFPAFLDAMRTRGFAGGNVTLPHKEAAFRACRRTTPVAARLGAANTLWLEGEVLCGDNTDVHGFAANLDERTPDWRGGTTAVVLGAGGASRAVIQALSEAGFREVFVLNRTPARAAALVAHFGGPVRAADPAALLEMLPRANIVVNATAAGLHGEDGFAVDWGAARADAIATDLVYVPLMTPFLREAAAHGLRTVDGLGMLLHQAAPGFDRWFGVRPEVDAALRHHVAADLGA